jgi:hypothetical protein
MALALSSACKTVLGSTDPDASAPIATLNTTLRPINETTPKLNRLKRLARTAALELGFGAIMSFP